MDEFFRKVIEGNGISPTEVCRQSFEKNFEDAVDVEWFDRENYIEAIFYKNNLEHIALFEKSGILVEYLQNLTPDNLPSAIREIVDSRGEIMNYVLKNKGNMLEYEVIIRDKDLNRYQITLTDPVKVIEEKKL